MQSEALTIDYTKQSHQLTELETKVLIQYQNLAKRLNHLAQVINKLIDQPSTKLLENLQLIESKISLVFTLFKGAVYSLFLQQEGMESNEQQQQESYNSESSMK